jgi:hypothetical protein
MLGTVATACGPHVRRIVARISIAHFFQLALELSVVALRACGAFEQRRVMVPTRRSGLAATSSFSAAP